MTKGNGVRIQGQKAGRSAACCNAAEAKRRPSVAETLTWQEVPQAATRLTLKDTLGAWRVRWGIGRMKFRVQPGLYAVGQPGPESEVLVTANYKMSFDLVRSQLSGRNLWLLVLDTQGVNVWCAAGKGTFGTEELVKKISETRLAQAVTHRRLILPQLGAPGVRGVEVTRRTGFRVVFGPVRAEDLPAYLDAGCVATPEMRRVQFTAGSRLELSPVELVSAVRPLSVVMAVLFLLNTTGLVQAGWRELMALGLAVLAGGVAAPLLLPLIPGRAFAWKGAVTGAVAAAIWVWMASGGMPWFSVPGTVAVMMAISSFMAMNFTGCSTYTSLPGVVREMRVAVPLQAVAACAGALIWLSGYMMQGVI